MLIQEIAANAHDLAGGELIKQRLDENFAVLVTLNVIDTMMLELANTGKQILGYKTELPITGIPGTPASGVWQFITNPINGEIIEVNGVPFTFVNGTDMQVAGAGTASVNGFYTSRGMSSGKPFYNLVGYPSYDPLAFPATSPVAAIVWESGLWIIYDVDGNLVYFSGENVATPDLVVTWTELDPGVVPVPTVVPYASGDTDIARGATAGDSAINFTTKLNASTNPAITLADYLEDADTVTGTCIATGIGGNGFTQADSSDGAIIASGATFTGGVDDISRGQTGLVDTSSFALDARFVRWRRNTTDKWEILDIVDTIEELTIKENDGEQAICFQGGTSAQTWFLSWLPTEDMTLEVWGRAISPEITELNGVPPFPPEYSLLAAYRVADFTLNQLLIIDGKTYRDFVIAQKASLQREQSRCEFIWKTYRFMPSDANRRQKTRPYDMDEDTVGAWDDSEYLTDSMQVS